MKRRSKNYRWLLVSVALTMALWLVGCNEAAPAEKSEPGTSQPIAVAPQPEPALSKPDDAAREKANSEILALVNAERKSHGLAELVISKPAEQLAQRRAEALAAAMQAGECGPTHDIPGLGEPWFASECISYGAFGTPRDVFVDIMGRERDKGIMLSPKMRVMGVGFMPGVPGPEGRKGDLYILVFAVAEAAQGEDEVSREKVAQKLLSLVNAQRTKLGFVELVQAKDLQEYSQRMAESVAAEASSGERHYRPEPGSILGPYRSSTMRKYSVQEVFEEMVRLSHGLLSIDREFGLGFVPNVKAPNDNGMPIHLYVVTIRSVR